MPFALLLAELSRNQRMWVGFVGMILMVYVRLRQQHLLEVAQDNDTTLALLFDPDQSLEERALKEQFEP